MKKHSQNIPLTTQSIWRKQEAAKLKRGTTMKYRHRYLKKIPTAITTDISRIDEMFDRMATKWAVRAEKNMRRYRRDHIGQPTFARRF